MIAKIAGRLIEKTNNALIIDVHGLHYEVIVPAAVLQRVDSFVDQQNQVHLITYHYIQLTPSNGVPVLVGFFNEVEREFFQKFITVSGIGPRAAVKALNKPISEIASAIDQGDLKFLKTLPGIGLQKAKEIVAKLQGKVGKYALIQDHSTGGWQPTPAEGSPEWQEEALEVLLQLQYKRPEAREMIQKALTTSSMIQTTEELLNVIYKQRMSP